MMLATWIAVPALTAANAVRVWHAAPAASAPLATAMSVGLGFVAFVAGISAYLLVGAVADLRKTRADALAAVSWTVVSLVGSALLFLVPAGSLARAPAAASGCGPGWIAVTVDPRALGEGGTDLPATDITVSVGDVVEVAARGRWFCGVGSWSGPEGVDPVTCNCPVPSGRYCSLVAATGVAPAREIGAAATWSIDARSQAGRLRLGVNDNLGESGEDARRLFGDNRGTVTACVRTTPRGP